MARSNECAPKGVPIMNFFNEKPSAKNPASKLHQVSEKAFMPKKKLFTVVWLSIKRWRDQMNAPLKVSPFWIYSNEKTFGKNLSPKLHQVSDKASTPTKKVITAVLSSIERWWYQINTSQKVSPLWIFFQWKSFRQKSRPKITSSQRKSLNASEKAYCCRVVNH